MCQCEGRLSRQAGTQNSQQQWASGYEAALASPVGCNALLVVPDVLDCVQLSVVALQQQPTEALMDRSVCASSGGTSDTDVPLDDSHSLVAESVCCVLSAGCCSEGLPYLPAGAGP